MKKQLFCTKNAKELNDELISLLNKQVNLRMQIKSGKFNKTHLLKKIRRDIARIKTFLSRFGGVI